MVVTFLFGGSVLYRQISQMTSDFHRRSQRFFPIRIFYILTRLVQVKNHIEVSFVGSHLQPKQSQSQNKPNYVTQSEIKDKFHDFFIDFVRFMILFLIIIDNIIVFGDPCGLHIIEINKHDLSRLQDKKQNENPLILSKFITVFLPLLPKTPKQCESI